MADETLRWKTSKGKDGSLQWEGVPPYEKDAALKKFIPKEAGKKYGHDNRRHNDLSLTLFEKDMLGDVNNHISATLQDWYSRCANQIQTDLNQIGTIIDSSHLFSAVKNKFDATARNLRQKLLHDHNQLLKTADDARRDLAMFKENNPGRPHIASYPESTLLHMAILFLCLIGEGIANAYFFSDNPLGLIGGFLEAFLISFANVAASFLAGWLCLRQLNHNSWARKSMGLIGFLAIVVFVVLLHLAAAHYREILQRSTGVEFFTSLAFDPRTLQDMQSFLLMGIGAAISLVAGYEGYNFDDPYPGYGKIYRKWKAFDDQVSKEQMNYKLELNAAYNGAVQEVDAISAILDAKEKALKDFGSEMSTYFACVNGYYGQAQDGASALITAFRGGVEAIWETAGSFPVTTELVNSQLHPIDPSQLKNDVTANLQQHLDALKKSRQNYAKNRENMIKQLDAERDKWIASVDSDLRGLTDIINSGRRENGDSKAKS